MKTLFAIAAIATLSACGSPEPEQTEAPVAEAETPAIAPLFETSWTFTRDDKAYRESIDADGAYIANLVTDSGEEHFDHGTYEMVDGKHCFTSAMNDDGQICWTAPDTIAVGETAVATSVAGDELSITRQEYEPLTM